MPMLGADKKRNPHKKEERRAINRQRPQPEDGKPMESQLSFQIVSKAPCSGAFFMSESFPFFVENVRNLSFMQKIDAHLFLLYLKKTVSNKRETEDKQARNNKTQ